MRFVVAIVLFAVASVSIGLGIAQRTIFLGPDHVSAEVELTSEAAFAVIDGEVLNSHPGSQLVSASGAGPVFMAYGRSVDVEAWVGESSAATLVYDTETLELTADSRRGVDEGNPSPAGSDLWIQEFEGTDTLVRKINVPRDVSVIVASDGTAAAPGEISITWPVDNSTPWSTPLIVGGIGVLLAGLIALMWALVHARRRHGPRRKTPKMPKPPKPPQLKPAPRRTALTTGTPDAGRGRRRMFVALPVMLVGAFALSACTADGHLAPAPEPSDTAAVLAEVDAPVVTERQFERIVGRVGDAVAAADAAGDAELAAARLAGPALSLRTANYTARAADAEVAAIAPFPTGEVGLILPQQRLEWPRVVFATISGDETAEFGAMFVQQTPRDPYRIHYLMRLTQSIPEVAPAALGAANLAPDSKLLAYTPEQLATEYGDVLINGDESQFAEHFDPENDLLRETFGAAYKAQRKSELTTATLEFAVAAGEQEPYAFATNDTGAIVAVDLRETETVKPAEAGAAINPKGAVKALSGKTTSTKGIAAEYVMQVLFYVPPLTAEGERVRVLGFTQGLVGASEVP